MHERGVELPSLSAAHVRFRDGAYRCSFCAWTHDDAPGYVRASWDHVAGAHPERLTVEAVEEMDVARAAALRKSRERT